MVKYCGGRPGLQGNEGDRPEENGLCLSGAGVSVLKGNSIGDSGDILVIRLTLGIPLLHTWVLFSQSIYSKIWDYNAI